MDWLWQFLEHLQTTAIFSVLHDLSVFDWLVVFVLLWGMGYGSHKGFSDMFAKVLEIFIVSMLVMSFYHYGAAFVVLRIPAIPIEVADPIVFFVMSIFIGLSVTWCVGAIGKVFRLEVSGVLKPLGGMCCGVIYFVFILSFLAQFLLFLPIESLKDTFQSGRGSRTGRIVAKFVPRVHEIFFGSFLNSSKPSTKATPAE